MKLYKEIKGVKGEKKYGDGSSGNWHKMFIGFYKYNSSIHRQSIVENTMVKFTLYITDNYELRSYM